MKKKLLLVVLVFIMAISPASLSHGMPPAKPKVILNGQELNLQGHDDLVVFKNNQPFVSAEFLSKSSRHVLGWNSKNQTLNIRDIKENDQALFAMSADEQTKTKLNDYMEALVKAENFHGSVLLAKEGKVLLNQGYGYGNFDQKIPNKSQTRFSIGSVTKQFTAFATIKLSQQGLIKMDDKVAQYIPDFPQGDNITIHHLLTHTSGLVNYTDLDGFLTADITNKDPMKILDLVKTLDLSFRPGEMFDYSNTNYLLLGIIIEKIRGETFASYLDKIIKPLGMEDTGIIASENNRLNDATPYAGYLEVYEIDDDLVLTQAYAAGSMYSTVEDLYRWDRSIKVLGEDLLDEIFKDRVAISEKLSYGYGWMLGDTGYGKEIFHGGNTLGSTTYVGRLINEDITIIILTNNRGYHVDQLKNKLLAITLGKPYEMPKAMTEIQIQDKSLYHQYTGKYKFIKENFLDIFEKDNKLYAQVTGQGPFEIFPHKINEFFAKILQVNIEFSPSIDGKAPALIFKQGSMAFICPRTNQKQALKEKKEGAQ